MNPHHGAMTDNSFLWSKYTIQYSSYPVLNIISSNPENKNGKPSYIMIENLINEIIESNKEDYKHSKNFCCIPHNISCNLNGEIFKYPSIQKEFLMPIFITYDASSNGYNIVIDSERMILRDNIIIFEQRDKIIDIPLYIYSASEINYNELNVKENITKDLIKLYSHYLIVKNLEEFNTEFRVLPNQHVINRDIIYEDFNDEIEKLKSLIIKLERCNLLNKVNDGTNKKDEQFKESEQYKKIEQSIKIIKYNNNIIVNFIKLSLMMKQTNENISKFLNFIYEYDNEIKEANNSNNEIDNVSSNDNVMDYNIFKQKKKRKIG